MKEENVEISTAEKMKISKQSFRPDSKDIIWYVQIVYKIIWLAQKSTRICINRR